MQTFGPTGDKAWDVMLGYTDADFRAMAESLVRKLPLGKPPTACPPTAPRRMEEAAEDGRMGPADPRPAGALGRGSDPFTQGRVLAVQ